MSDNTHLSSSHLLQGKSIAIVGGGPAGFTVARLLELEGVDVCVYESDEQLRVRSQGGSLDLHEGSGQLALSRCGLSDRFKDLSRPEGQASIVFDKTGLVCAVSSAEQESETSPEIDRGDLRELLCHSLKDETVRWGHRIVDLTPEGADRHRLHFHGGDAAVADLVIGCDGAWSKVRRLVTPSVPVYTGVTFVETRLTDVDSRHPQISELVGLGSAMALGDHKGILAQRNGDGSIRVYVARRQSEDWLTHEGLDLRDSDGIRSRLLTYFHDWSPKVRQLLTDCEGSFKLWPLYAASTEGGWPTRAGVTIIGDAAHVMPPFLGAGANMAMLDAVELTQLICNTDFSCLHDALRAFEKGMMDRMKPMIQKAVAIQDILFADDAPDGIVALMQSS